MQDHLVPPAAPQGLKAVREIVETKRHTPWRHTRRCAPILFIAVWCTLLLIQGILPVIFSHYQLSKGRLLAALTPASIHLAPSAARRLHSGCSHSGAKLLTYNFCFRNNTQFALQKNTCRGEWAVMDCSCPNYHAHSKKAGGPSEGWRGIQMQALFSALLEVHGTTKHSR